MTEESHSGVSQKMWRYICLHTETCTHTLALKQSQQSCSQQRKVRNSLNITQLVSGQTKWYFHAMVYNWAIKKKQTTSDTCCIVDKPQKHYTERKQTQENIYQCFRVKCPEKASLQKQIIDWWLPEGLGWGKPGETV